MSESTMSQCADIPTLILAKLIEHDHEEGVRLFEVCKSYGFFYLDYRGCSSWPDAAIRSLFAFSDRFFDTAETEKLKISMESTGTYFGYKPRGANVVDKAGNRDQNEFLNISKADILNVKDLASSTLEVLDAGILKDCQNFIVGIHMILQAMLASLSDTLELQSSERLENFHLLDCVSGDHLRLAKYSSPKTRSARSNGAESAEIMLIPHTDFGTLTLLLTDRPGLQLRDPQDEMWKDVIPRAGHAIVNVGDCLAKFSNGLFKACQHRVVKHPGLEIAAPSPTEDNSRVHKLSLGYFLRPADDATLRTLYSAAIPISEDPSSNQAMRAKDWVDARVQASKVSNFGTTTAWIDLRGTASVW